MYVSVQMTLGVITATADTLKERKREKKCDLPSIRGNAITDNICVSLARCCVEDLSDCFQTASVFLCF
jgi:hypothetical protein